MGSDEIIRQFPPEEFLTVAKFIASKDLSEIVEDFLKGVLFDQYIALARKVLIVSVTNF